MNDVKLYRVILNILFYIFYVLLVSFGFSFIFPTLQVILWYNIWLGNDARFDSIQIAIIVLVLVFSLILRKYFYVPIREKYSTKKIKKKKIEKKEVIKKEVIDNSPELDIKIGKEINN